MGIKPQVQMLGYQQRQKKSTYRLLFNKKRGNYSWYREGRSSLIHLCFRLHNILQKLIWTRGQKYRPERKILRYGQIISAFWNPASSTERTSCKNIWSVQQSSLKFRPWKRSLETQEGQIQYLFKIRGKWNMGKCWLVSLPGKSPAEIATWSIYKNPKEKQLTKKTAQHNEFIE